MGTFVQLPQIAPAYQYLGKTVLAAPASSISLASIPSGFYGLIVFFVSKSTSGSIGCNMVLNDDGGANYNYEYIQITDAASACSKGVAASFYACFTTDDVNFNNGEVTILQVPAGSNRSIQASGGFCNATHGQITHSCGNWQGVAEVNKITINATSATFATGSAIYVYGVK